MPEPAAPAPPPAAPTPAPSAAREPDAGSAVEACLEGQVQPRPDLAPPAPPRAPPLAPRRQVICGDALTWLEGQGGALAGASLITSLPDLAELHPMPLAEWRAWFIAAAAAVLRACPPDGAAIFYQTDIKHEGAWIDKGYLCQRAAEEVGAALLWHRIVCRAPPGAITFGRPAYAHLLAFAPRPREELAWSTADVLPSGGEMLWSRAIGLDACALACRYVRDHTLTRTIVDPFCGRGTVLAVANHLGLDAVGVDRSPSRCRRAERLVLDPALAPRP